MWDLGRLQNRDLGWIAIAIAICTVYIACIVRLTALPMQDYPNHVARAAVMADLVFHGGSRFGQHFELQLAAIPYVLPDLILMSLIAVFGVAVATAAFTALVLLCLPCAMYFYAYAKDLPPRARLFVFLIGLYLSTDWFFLSGFMAFRLSLALIVVSLGIAEMLRRRWRTYLYAAHIGVLLLGYLTHLTAPLFLTVALGAIALLRLWLGSTSVRLECYVLAPLLLVWGWHLGFAGETQADSAAVDISWARPGEGSALTRKLRGLGFEFTDFNWNLASSPLTLFAACLFIPAFMGFNKSALFKSGAVEGMLLAAAFAAIYFALPFKYNGAHLMYLDVRALPMIPILFVYAWIPALSLASGHSSKGGTLALALAAVLAGGNLVYVTAALTQADTWINEYRSLEAWIPRGSYVLTVHTETNQPHVLHVGSHAVLDRGAIIPYLFNGNDGDPQRYFRYLDKPYAPRPQWYREQLHGLSKATRSPDASVDWNQVACTYQFVLITMPFDPHLIATPTTMIVRNDTAALLTVDQQACRSPAQRAAQPRIPRQSCEESGMRCRSRLAPSSMAR